MYLHILYGDASSYHVMSKKGFSMKNAWDVQEMINVKKNKIRLKWIYSAFENAFLKLYKY